jgi:hypothetical protein
MQLLTACASLGAYCAEGTSFAKALQMELGARAIHGCRSM